MMNILEVNYADKVGHIFNGYDLHRALMQKDVKAKQLVIDKRTKDDSVVKLRIDTILHQQIKEIERQYSISNLLYPYGTEIENMKEFQEADIVHYHILHNGMISLLDYPKLMNQKLSVWTIHDPWILTGCCVHPLKCKKWKSGCESCNRYRESLLPLMYDNTAFMWNVKKEVLSKINPNIVVSSNFMKEYLQKSPLTGHFNKITVIPFGIKTQQYNIQDKMIIKGKNTRKDDTITIGFRAEVNYIKGNYYLYEALRKIKNKKKFELLCVGSGQIPDDIKRDFYITELGWIDDEKKLIDFFLASDIFVMPSLAESFGLMAVEAMAAGCLVICFENTIVAEIVEAPNCGAAVEYLSDTQLCKMIEKLAYQPEEIARRGKLGRKIVEEKYQFADYVDKHRQLYETILNG